MDPNVSSLQNYAIKNVQQQMGTLKTSKELQADDKSSIKEDFVELTSANIDPSSAKEAKEHLENAAQAGLMSELKEREKNKEKEKIEEGVLYQPTAEGKEKQASAPTNQEKVVEKIDTSSKPVDTVHLYKDIPSEKLETAKKIVEGQIDASRKPSASLVEMKVPEGIAAIETKNADYHPIMDIHDTSNSPVSII